MTALPADSATPAVTPAAVASGPGSSSSSFSWGALQVSTSIEQKQFKSSESQMSVCHKPNPSASKTHSCLFAIMPHP